MNAALIRIAARGKSGNRVAAAGVYGPGIKTAGLPFFKTAVVGDGMVGGRRIVPSDGSPTGDGDGGRHIVRRPAVH